MKFLVNDARIFLAFKYCFLVATLSSQLCCLTKSFQVIALFTMIHCFEFDEQNLL